MVRECPVTPMTIGAAPPIATQTTGQAVITHVPRATTVTTEGEQTMALETTVPRIHAIPQAMLWIQCTGTTTDMTGPWRLTTSRDTRTTICHPSTMTEACTRSTCRNRGQLPTSLTPPPWGTELSVTEGWLAGVQTETTGILVKGVSSTTDMDMRRVTVTKARTRLLMKCWAVFTGKEKHFTHGADYRLRISATTTTGLVRCD